ncbi:hypothetical protein [Mesorhizobium sp. CCNWLY176]|uniref:hypothetical protein n=1 Tax=Mesorhizobium sp. CCNWLY176 TaxID=3128543 RepID=UPI00301C3E35
MKSDTAMANGENDPTAHYARLWERVENQGRDIIDLRSNMNTGFRNIESSIHSLSNELRGSTKTQWPVIWSAIGVCFVVLGAVGNQALSPIKDNLAETRTAIARLAETTVTRQEMDQRAQRGLEDRTRTDMAITDLRAAAVTRNEWTERNRARDQEVADLGRRVDELRQDVGSVYGTRDVIIDLKKEIDNLRQRFNLRPASPP